MTLARSRGEEDLRLSLRQKREGTTLLRRGPYENNLRGRFHERRARPLSVDGLTDLRGLYPDVSDPSVKEPPSVHHRQGFGQLRTRRPQEASGRFLHEILHGQGADVSRLHHGVMLARSLGLVGISVVRPGRVSVHDAVVGTGELHFKMMRKVRVSHVSSSFLTGCSAACAAAFSRASNSASRSSPRVESSSVP